MKTPIALLVTILAPIASPALAKEGPLDKRAKDVASLLVAEPKWADDLFDAAFLKAVPPDKIRELCTSVHAEHGVVRTTVSKKSDSEFSGSFEFTFADGGVMPVKLSVVPKAPHSVVGLWFGPVASGVKDFAALGEAFGKLPGKTSFSVVRLGASDAAGKSTTIAEHDADRALALGSAFKLYILGALAKDVADGKRKLEDVVRLDERRRSLPSGKLHKWPVGSPVTLATLASLMISESDNTATDNLLFALGRERVEAMLKPMGNSAPERDIPFLSTGEMFRLKALGDGSAAEKFLALDAKGRRAFLDGELATVPLDEHRLNGELMAKPSHLDTIEWFASAADMCRAMDWLRKATESGKAADLRGILSINAGIENARDEYAWMGFKGGSETGVINLTFLLRAKSDAWYALSAGWNDENDAVDQDKFVGLVSRALDLLALQAGTSAK
jgi:hypothetical protein